MPTYEYECPTCGVFEAFQNIREERLKSCPTCRGRKIKRLLGRGAGIIFKGTGFYETDYRRANQGKEKTEPTAGDAKAAGAANAKPAKSDAAKPADAKPTASAGASGTAKDGKVGKA